MKKIMLMLLVTAFAFPAVCFSQSNDWRRPFYSTADYLRDMKATTQRYSKVVDNYTSWLDSHFSYKPPTQVIYYDPYWNSRTHYQSDLPIVINFIQVKQYPTYEYRSLNWSQAAQPIYRDSGLSLSELIEENKRLDKIILEVINKKRGIRYSYDGLPEIDGTNYTLADYLKDINLRRKKMIEEKEKAEDLAFLEKEGFVTPARRAQLLEYIKKTNFLSLSFLFF
jgi:hypothetical protein